MILSYKHRFVFIKGRKVGGTSLEVALSSVCGPHDIITPITPVDEHLRLSVGRPCQNFCADQDLEACYIDLVRQQKYLEALKTRVHGARTANFVNHSSLQDVENATNLRSEEFTKILCERSPYSKLISLASMRLSFRTYDGSPMINSAEDIRVEIARIMDAGEHKRLNNLGLYETSRTYARTVVLRQETLAEDYAALCSNFGFAEFAALPHVKQGTLHLSNSPFTMLTREQILEVNRHFADEFERFGYEKL